MTREEIELSMIREYSVNGVILTNMNRADMLEHVRVQIHKTHAPGERFQASELTYSQAYREWSGRPLELRLKPRTGNETDLEDSLTRKIDALADHDDQDDQT